MIRKYRLAALALSALVGQTAHCNDGMYLVVTPAWAGDFTCKFRPETDPPSISNELVRFRVTVRGASGPYKWRLPLYEQNNQSGNMMSVARIGTGKAGADNSFTIDLSTVDLGRVSGSRMMVEVTGKDGQETTCSTPVDRLRNLAETKTPAEMAVMKSGITR